MDLNDTDKPLGDHLPEGFLVAGRYEIQGMLGTGGMGSVYIAADRILAGESIAIKILHRQYAYETKYTQRFLREVQLMRRVNHKNVVRTFDVGADQDLVYFTMEYVPGHSLFDFMEQSTFPVASFPHLIEQICEGLESIHEAEIIHRDLKPENIMLLADNSLKIADFGVARPEYSELTAHNEVLGSSSYMAPEIWKGDPITSSVDLYSLGIILYELCTNELPFQADSPANMMRMHLYDSPPPPRTVNKNIPRWLSRLVMKLLAKEPDQRPSCAREIIDYVTSSEDSITRSSSTDAKIQKRGERSEASLFIAQLESTSKRATDSNATMVAKRRTQKYAPRMFSWSMRVPYRTRFVHQLMGDRVFGHVQQQYGRVFLRQWLFAFAFLGLMLVGISMAQNALGPLPKQLPSTYTHTFEGEQPKARKTQYYGEDAFGVIPDIPEDVTTSFQTLKQIGWQRAGHSLLFVLLISLPAALIGALSGSLRNTFRSLLAAIVFNSFAGISLLGFHLSPIWKNSAIDLPSLVSASAAVKTQLAEVVILCPFVTKFQAMVLGDGLLLHTPEQLPLTSYFPSLAVSFLYILFISILARIALEPDYKRPGLSYFLVGVAALVFLPMEALFVPIKHFHEVLFQETVEILSYSLHLPIALSQAHFWNFAYVAFAITICIPLFGGLKGRRGEP